MQKAEPKIGEQYIAFAEYDEGLDAYILPNHKWSLVNVSTTNLETAKFIIKRIQKNPNLSYCEYFHLIAKNFNEPISPVMRDLNNIATYFNNIDSTFCIDSKMKKEIYEDYLTTNNYELLPYIRNYRQSAIDSILIHQTYELLDVIGRSRDIYWLEEALTILGNLKNLSYIYNSKEAMSECDKIESEYYEKFDKFFVVQVNELLKKYRD